MTYYDHRITVKGHSLVISIPENASYTEQMEILELLNEAEALDTANTELWTRIKDLEARAGQLDLADG